MDQPKGVIVGNWLSNEEIIRIQSEVDLAVKNEKLKPTDADFYFKNQVNNAIAKTREEQLLLELEGSSTYEMREEHYQNG